MKVYLIHHANTLSVEQDPERHLSETGRNQCASLGARLKAAGANPVRILHSDKQWSRESAQRIAAALGLEGRTAMPDYPINTGHDLAPFLKEIAESDGDIMMVGHSDFLMRTGAKLVCGDETKHVIEFKPGHGSTFCIDDSTGDWAIAWAWRVEHLMAAA